MITYNFKLYRNKHNKQLTQLLREACFVWNHCLSLQRRYHRLFGKYASANDVKTHFPHWYKMAHLDSQTVQEIIERIDLAYKRFFKHLAERPPKYKRHEDMTSIVFKQSGYRLEGNRFTVNKLKRTFRFSLSQPYEGKVKRVSVKRTPLGEFFICVVTDAEPRHYGKSRNGASVGIDFGLKTYLTLSDGSRAENPQFLRHHLNKIQKASKRLSKAQKGSNHRKQRKMELNRAYEKVSNARTDFQWKLAHELCRAYDFIFLEDLNLEGMRRHKHWGRKMSDLAHGNFVSILEMVAAKYGCTVHKIDRWYPSSKMCECGYKNDNLQLTDRTWVCPVCGQVHDRDVNAARNILRRGIAELESNNKTSHPEAACSCVSI